MENILYYLFLTFYIAESMNNKIKTYLNHEKHTVPEIVSKLQNMVQQEQLDIFDAFIGAGEIRLQPFMKYCRIDQAKWESLDDGEKKKHFTKFLQGPTSAQEKQMSVSQYGTVIKDPGICLKPGTKRSRNPKSMDNKTKSFKPKAEPKVKPMNCDQLRTALAERNLNTKGKKAELQARLNDANGVADADVSVGKTKNQKKKPWVDQVLNINSLKDFMRERFSGVEKKPQGNTNKESPEHDQEQLIEQSQSGNMFEEDFLRDSNSLLDISTDDEDKNPKIVPRKPPNDVTFEVSQDELDFVDGVGRPNNIEEFNI